MVDLKDDDRFYSNEGARTGIILLHAYTGSPMDVNPLAHKLNREGYAVLAPMFTGHGTKDVNDLLSADISDWQEDSQRALTWMENQDFDKIMVFGLSLGGLLATWLINQYPKQIQAGGMFNSPILADQPIHLDRPFMAYVKALYKARGKSDQYEIEAAGILDRHHQQVEGIDTLRRQVSAGLEDISMPFYIAQSGKDDLVDPQVEEVFAQFLPNTKLDYHYFPGLTHVITVNRDRRAFEDSVIHFIRQSS